MDKNRESVKITHEKKRNKDKMYSECEKFHGMFYNLSIETLEGLRMQHLSLLLTNEDIFLVVYNYNNPAV